MRKSIPAFIMGLIWSIVGACASIAFTYVIILITALSRAKFGNILTIITIVNFVTFAITFIASFFCFKFARVAGTIMIFSEIISFGCLITLFIILKSFSPKILLFWIPSLFILVSGIIGVATKKSFK